MDAALRGVVRDLAEQAARHDAGEPDRLRRWRVLEVDAGRFLWFLAQAVGARDIVEIGTSRGMSTLWLGDAARATGGRVTSVDVDADAQRAAAADVARAGLAEYVDFRHGDGGSILASLPDESVDLLFLDAERTEYPNWWPHPSRVLRPGGVLIADNALSHVDEMEPLREIVENDPELVTTTLEIGKGELVALKRR
ncbi:putative O-methyltransferase YrrM [Streptoalloteichus tenebrarius]|uniref:O-methyltransferase YrrM n=1 Tax=Streptoalloteichus tenebrarius (strain ATCC 17920 / DSM 40477 / JCM 4838 / CBS 697.72 / NBRC 16177 / NCIMB 11028 / NRRL B-12390 / A12253. 1 / ISP 5477) TaxID=1933 RepID=A0ABT1HPI9_STRSD|nr:class I SAM-dependent methyltransferase [Streptoalloteichus tenebrarius]MCP2257431.1 putative O-methyltransferase YrrM [Streptoalloteichus tenebrarius]BFE98376.1 class I SAM-dependent methyltransferase [Streptoalloteichus tenebrarius]